MILPIIRKSVFVGSCSREKAALLFTYLNGYYPKDYVPSISDNTFVTVQCEGTTFSLGLWDTAGQEEYDRLRPLSYPDTHVFIICFSIIDMLSFTDIKDKWVPELNLNCPDTPIVLCGLQSEYRSIDPEKIKVSKEMAEEMRKEMNCTGYVECSALENDGIDVLMDLVTRTALIDPKVSDKKEKKKSKSGIFGKLKNVFQTKTNNSSPTIMESKQSLDVSTIIRLPTFGLPTTPSPEVTSPHEEKKVSNSPIIRDYNQISFEEWTSEEVSKWLEVKGCNQSVIDVLKNNDFGGTALLFCEKQDLTGLGISLGNAITIIKWVESFKNSSPSNDSKKKEGTQSNGSSTSSFDFPSSFQMEFKQTTNEKEEENEFEKRYTVLEKLGEGGFGKVYKVMTRKSKEIRAVKVVSPNQDFTINQALSEAMKQAQLYRLDNHIVHVYDVFIAVENFGQIVCIEMECMEGNLRSVFKGRKVSEEMIWSIIRQIGASLKFLSESGKIIHRDIKPDNILVKKVDYESNEIEVYLSDFGLAKSSTNSIQTSHLSGTLFYLAPEILEYGISQNETNRTPYSIASDIFALGVSLYQIMSHDNTSNIATLCKYGTDLIRQNIPQNEYSEKLTSLVLEMLKKDPNERPSIDQIMDF